MIRQLENLFIFYTCPLLLFLTIFALDFTEVSGVKYDPVPFDRIPIAKVNSERGEYEIGADFSIDYGDETAIQKDNHSKSADGMVLDNSYNGTSLKLQCDGNDRCDTTLAPRDVVIYLVDSKITDEQVINKSIPTLELADINCGSKSIKDCAEFSFSIPGDILVQNYSLVLDMSFDEAKWIYVNTITIR